MFDKTRINIKCLISIQAPGWGWKVNWYSQKPWKQISVRCSCGCRYTRLGNLKLGLPSFPSSFPTFWLGLPLPQRAAVDFFLRLHVCTAYFLSWWNIGGFLGGWVPARSVAQIQSCKSGCLRPVYPWLGVKIEFVSWSGTALMGDGFKQGGCPCFIQCEQGEMLLLGFRRALTDGSVDSSILCSLFKQL